MQANKILFPTDFSHCGDKALVMAESIARDNNAHLFIVHVEELPVSYGGGDMYYGMPEPNTAQLKELLAAVKPRDSGVAYSHHLIVGEPADAVARFAEENDVDIIVLGTHGRSGFMRLLMGSVAEAIVRKAKCAVLTVRQPDNGEED